MRTGRAAPSGTGERPEDPLFHSRLSESGRTGSGLFVRARLQQMAPDAEIKVMSLPGSRPHLLDEYNEDRARYAQKDHINE